MILRQAEKCPYLGQHDLDLLIAVEYFPARLSTLILTSTVHILMQM
jgi:hypothetical protein